MIEPVMVVGLVALGLGHLLAKLTGPFGLAAALRWVLTQWWLPDWVRGGALCPFCWAFWAALLATWWLMPLQPWPAFMVTWLGGYGLTVFALLYTGH